MVDLLGQRLVEPMAVLMVESTAVAMVVLLEMKMVE